MEGVLSSIDKALLISTNPNRHEVQAAALRAAGWHLRATSQPAEALELLRNSEFNAVFCDDQLRGATAAGFLTWTRRLLPQASFHVFGVAGSWSAPAGAPPDGFLSYPPISAELPGPEGSKPASTVSEDESSIPMSGNTSLISLPQLLDFLRISKRDAVIKLHEGRGSVFLKSGLVLDARHQSAGEASSGLAALSKLISLTDCDFRVEEFRPPERTTINLPVTGAVSEAARQADEHGRDRAVIRKLLEHEPGLLAAAIGYRLGAAPADGHGDSTRIFRTALQLLDNNRAQLGAPVRSISVSGDQVSLAVLLFGQGRLVAVASRGSRGGELLGLLVAVTKREN